MGICHLSSVKECVFQGFPAWAVPSGRRLKNEETYKHLILSDKVRRDDSTVRSGFYSVGIKIVNNQLFINPAAVLIRTHNHQSNSNPLTPPHPESLEYLEITYPRTLKFIEITKHGDLNDAEHVASVRDFADLKQSEALKNHEKLKL